MRRLAKAVHGAGGEAAEAAGVLDRVVQPVRARGGARAAVFHAQAVAAQGRCGDVGVEGGEAHAHGVHGADGICQQVGLAAGRDLAPVAAQAHDGRAVEEFAGVGGGAGVQVQAGFQVEQGVHAAAQVFAPAKAKAAGGVDAAGQRGARGVAGRVGGGEAAGVAHAGIGNAVERDAGLRKGGQRCGGEGDQHQGFGVHGCGEGDRAGQRHAAAVPLQRR